MGIEQGTPVVGSNFELPLNIDLPDLRLPRAFNSWTDFQQRHAVQIKTLGSLPVAQVIVLANELAVSVSQAIGIDPANKLRHINPDKLTRLTDSILGEGNRVIFMRHGEQSPPEWVYSISDPALRKIRMMQNPFNKEDLLTNQCLVEVFLTAFSLLYLKEITGRKVHILSSENSRAKEMGEIFSTIISDATFSTNEGLNCIIYKDERDRPPVSIEDLLTDLPSGMMPWEPSLVDKLCKDTRAGFKQSEAIINTIDSLVQDGTQKVGHDLFIVLTHSQQLAEVLRSVGRLKDPATRVPELSIMTMNSPTEVLIFNEGILGESDIRPRKKNMRKVLETSGEGYEWYKIRRAEYETDQQIPFLVSPEPLYLSAEEGSEVLRIGNDVVDFMHAADELYKSEQEVKQLLDRGKPEILQQAREAQYLFVRPDLLITKDGFSICEIETSPFGLALAELLNRAYRLAGFNTMVEEGVLREFIVNNTPLQGIIIYSEKTSSYSGQLQFLAREIFSGGEREWRTEQADKLLGENFTNVYRGFYQHEFTNDLFVNSLMQTLEDNSQVNVKPSFTPHMEEKALLALIWDSRWESFLIKQLGEVTFAHLRKVVPPTWVIGQEQFFSLGMPSGIASSEGLANISKSKRNFVLKKSGFGNDSSWGEGVSFLQEKSATQARNLLVAALKDSQSLCIVQEFKPSQEKPMVYDKDGHNLGQMQARIRLTPYFSMAKGSEGHLIAMKATGCEDTNYIHASTGSINTAVTAV